MKVLSSLDLNGNSWSLNGVANVLDRVRAAIAILSARLDFTRDYQNSLSDGANKLTLADLNQEGANMLAMQIRTQLSIQSLAFAGQSAQSILTLFR